MLFVFGSGFRIGPRRRPRNSPWESEMSDLKRPMINDALRLIRLYHGLSQKQIASELSLSQSMISEIESGTKSVSIDVLEKYSQRLNIRMSQLVFFAEELADNPAKGKGKLFIANKVISILSAIAPSDISDAH